MSSNQVYTVKQALEKASKFCAYQERYQQEVRKKLQSFQLDSWEIEEVISELITQNFLNEERFAETYSRGKFRINKWGKIKIKHALEIKSISEYCINKGLAQIDEEQYLSTIKELLSKKVQFHPEPSYNEKAKAVKFVIGKGYEPNLVWDQLNILLND